MALTPSTMQSLGSVAPEFELLDVESNEMVGLDEYGDAKGYLVMFICNHCPYVKHVADEISRLGREYMDKGIAVFAISSNDADSYPEDSPEKMKQEAEQRGYVFPYLHDADQLVAKAYTAACTPDFFLYDAGKKLVYRGQLDDTRPTRIQSGVYEQDNAANGHDLRQALDQLLNDQVVTVEQKPSMGCNIKWKTGNEPQYSG
ncbi:thiol-disulfide oxidoreductase [Poriferisphaera corsica]|uniref:Thiol-disulfide oxidoreductase n=1 Tax=Poriferisphaera corsica TaxID=2528020 RepID=A0A517YZF1_9BACT|nr:thioredoxin family protein [Poriferisphaera corsica]QDU35618.1 thiol-disulfide oxidoreductase [Poriferisphaera corsica]